MQNKLRGYGLAMLCVLLLGSVGCQKSIPLDDLVKTQKETMPAQKSAQKLNMNAAIKQHKLVYADNLYLEYRGEHPDLSLIHI